MFERWDFFEINIEINFETEGKKKMLKLWYLNHSNIKVFTLII